MDLSYRTYTSPISAWRTPRRHERLTLGVACSLNWGPLRDLIGRYRRRRPEVDLVIEDLDETSMADRIPGRRVDIAVALHDAGAPGWRSTPLWSEPLMAFMAEGHPLAACNSVPSAALRETPILMAGNGAGDRALQRAMADMPPADKAAIPCRLGIAPDTTPGRRVARRRWNRVRSSID